ncbi:hypothetical protein [Tautonia sociabilis]|uniref:Uncharacterized protein n=1 Tax=Tautonia sociabilis TaxID=2080755 RepID=A0A432MEU1_9BACT|nr:hypothetical protein [Tautonia sociabilis]RUL84203.1 hypothetical protein TsocGM_20990 [Tautonia sociabilis]
MRRPGFRSGLSVILADGQRWTLPLPAEADREEIPAPVEEHIRAILEMIREAEDRAELLRAELALGIHLLSINYRLGPEQYQELLSFERSSPMRETSQEAFHRAALAYLRRLNAEEGRADHLVIGERYPPEGLLGLVTQFLRRLWGRSPVSE